MMCPHGHYQGESCQLCSGPARACYDCERLTGGRCWRHSTTTVVLPSYTFLPFEPIDSTVHPVVISPEGLSAAVVPVGILPGLSWAPPPAIASNVGGCVVPMLGQLLLS